MHDNLAINPSKGKLPNGDKSIKNGYKAEEWRQAYNAIKNKNGVKSNELPSVALFGPSGKFMDKATKTSTYTAAPLGKNIWNLLSTGKFLKPTIEEKVIPADGKISEREYLQYCYDNHLANTPPLGNR